MLNELNLSSSPSVSSFETGKLGVRHLKRFWNKALLNRENRLPKTDWHNEWQIDKTMFSVLGIGLEQCITYLFQYAPSFEQFEEWIIETAGIPVHENVLRFNKIFSEVALPDESPEIPTFFNQEQLDFWEANGYIIIKNAIPKEDCEQTIEVICRFIGVDRNEPQSWYKPHAARQGIMVQLFQHALLHKNRQADKIRMAFEQLWQRKDIWVTTDRVGFNPPETGDWQFPGPDLHWDCSLHPPIIFGLQGILYLSDTAANQGAFTLVPGFQHRVESWLDSLPAGADPRQQNLHALGSKAIVADAGDFIIWHQALPHGSSANRSDNPRFVQYIKYKPADENEPTIWQ
ncbi:MAG TPA: phytanoyl-CoA dioxygenase family protein [Mucilaginibacter sp.]